MRREGHVACTGVECMQSFDMKTRRDHYEDLDANARILLKWILEKQCGKMWRGFIWLKRGTSGAVL
jgi:hypothetical protein